MSIIRLYSKNKQCSSIALVISALFIAQIILSESKSLQSLNSDLEIDLDQDTDDESFGTLEDDVEYFADILKARKQPTPGKAIFFLVNPIHGKPIVKLTSRYTILINFANF